MALRSTAAPSLNTPIHIPGCCNSIWVRARRRGGDQAGAFCARSAAPKGAPALAKRGVGRPPAGPHPSRGACGGLVQRVRAGLRARDLQDFALGSALGRRDCRRRQFEVAGAEACSYPAWQMDGFGLRATTFVGPGARDEVGVESRCCAMSMRE